jgi:hypothetical protein
VTSAGRASLSWSGPSPMVGRGRWARTRVLEFNRTDQAGSRAPVAQSDRARVSYTSPAARGAHEPARLLGILIVRRAPACTIEHRSAPAWARLWARRSREKAQGYSSPLAVPGPQRPVRTVLA